MSKIRGQEYRDALQGIFSLGNKCAYCANSPIFYFTKRQMTLDAGMYVCERCWTKKALDGKGYTRIFQKPRTLTITGEVHG